MADFKNSNSPAESKAEKLSPRQRAYLQELGAKFFLDNKLIGGFQVEYTENYESFSLFRGLLDGIPTDFYVYSVMYPENFNKLNKELAEFFGVYNSLKNVSVEKGIHTDVYALGLGFVNKNASEEEKGVLKSGVKYSVAIGDVRLIALPPDRCYGYSVFNPINLSLVSNEYEYFKYLVPQKGTVKSINRIGSFMGTNEMLNDKWEISVAVGGVCQLTYKYTLFMNPYERIRPDWENGLYIKAPKKLPVFFNWR